LNQNIGDKKYAKLNMRHHPVGQFMWKMMHFSKVKKKSMSNKVSSKCQVYASRLSRQSMDRPSELA